MWGRRMRSRRGRTVARELLPAVGTVVDLGVGDGAREWRSRVESVGPASLWVVAPLARAGGVQPLPVGTEVVLTWPTEFGLVAALCVLQGVEPAEIATWRLSLRDVERRQRRAAYRLTVAVPLRVHHGDEQIPGHTLDLSEAGLRCRLGSRTAPAVGDRVELALDLHEQERLVLPGRVVRRAPDHDGEPVVGITLLADEGTERLRRFVFAEQLRRRGAAL